MVWTFESYKNRFTENFTLTGGFDGRYYRGYHAEKIDDLLGGAYYAPGSKAWISRLQMRF